MNPNRHEFAMWRPSSDPFFFLRKKTKKIEKQFKKKNNNKVVNPMEVH